MRLGVVIPTLGRSPALPEVLDGLERQQDAPEFEVLVVLDAQACSEPSLGRSDVRVLKAARPGASAARNVGWRATNAPLVLFLDDDIVPGPRLVAEHVDWHGLHPAPNVGVLGAVSWSRSVTVTPFMRWLERGIQFDYGTIDGIEVGWQRFYTCNASIKRSLLEGTGGFDEVRFPYGYEDLELARRMWSTFGFRLLYNERARAEHLKTETLEGWRRNLGRIAAAERRFTELYPEERPYFFERFRAAATAPAARGRSARLARLVKPDLPWLGSIVWRSFDLVCTQRLAGEFLSEWEAAGGA